MSCDFKDWEIQIDGLTVTLKPTKEQWMECIMTDPAFKEYREKLLRLCAEATEELYDRDL